MKIRRLRTRFLLAGGLLVVVTLASGLWSGLTFARLSAVVDDTLRENQETIDLTALLAGTLERADDALLLALSGEPEGARKQLVAQRRRFDEDYGRLLTRLREPAEQVAATALRDDVAAYQAAGDGLLYAAGRPGAWDRYHRQVNPALRRAVADCARIREVNYQSMRQAGVRARDEARRATFLVAGISAAAFALTAAVLLVLARAVLGPVLGLTAGVDAVRRGDFCHRVVPASTDELGQLAEGFNRMAEALADYRSSSLGELLQAKHTLEATLAALPDAVIVIDPAERVVTLNHPAREVLGATADGEDCRVEQLPLATEHRAAVRAALRGQASIPTRTDFNGAVDVPGRGGPSKYLLKAMPIPEFAPRQAGAVVVLDDVTEFARLDELRSELVGVASHELKTPLTTLQMNLLLIGERADNLTPRQREMLAAAAVGCEELAGTIDELLDLTRSEAGQLRLNPGPVDVAALVERTLEPLRPRFADADIALHSETELRPALVQGDAARLRTVIANLVANALKYTPHGGCVTVRVASGQFAGEGAGGAVQIAVTDTGPGIPEEFRERVFEKFFRVEHQRPAGADGMRGTGIGLYLCRQIVAAHGGRIWCEPGPGGRGTRFAVELPRGI
jgi:NtrC-family two-component system sensor histidine kinase KinB